MSHPSHASRRHSIGFNGGTTSTRRHLQRKNLNPITQSQQALAKRIKAGRQSKGSQLMRHQQDMPVHLSSLKIEHRLLDGGSSAINLVRTTGCDVDGAYLIMSIDVHAPLAAAYDAWNKFPDFPHFMKITQEIDQFDGSGMTWRVHTPRQPFIWRAVVCDQQPCTHIAWKSLRGTTHPNFGSVSFEPTDSRETCIFVQIAFEVNGYDGEFGDPLPSLSYSLERSLRRFHSSLESQVVEAEVSRSDRMLEFAA
jgi:hypothetical protein